MKTFFTLILSVCSLCSLTAHSAVFNPNLVNSDTIDGDKKLVISIGSSRESGDLHLHFTDGKKGIASITVTNDSGKIVLQQTNQLSGDSNIIALKKANNLADGSYTVNLLLNNEKFTTRFVIWK